MSIISLNFILLIFGTTILYYLVPKRFQWVVLLISSLGFYVLSCGYRVIYILMTATATYGAALLIESIRNRQKQYIKENKATLTRDERKALKNKSSKKQRAVLILTLIFNFGLLCVFKYCHFAIDSFNSLMTVLSLETVEDKINWIMPLGISFYTFQSVGYLVDVYWETSKAQKNYAKMLLFVSFFPQITQGPIGDYEHLNGELFKEHSLTYDNFSRGFQRMIWGFAKKILIANQISPIVNEVFARYNELSGVTCLFGAFGYSIQIYADFSGYMDIMCGICEMFGITLEENFERPYFSKSIAEYWRRWHITLGTWFKKYIYYPIGVSKWNRNLGKKLSKKFGAHIGKTLPASIALVVVWLTTGLWHGASWAYVAWGGVNGLFIIASLWLEPVYDKTKAKLKINESSFLWRAFQTIRTFLLVTVIKVLPEVGTLSDGIELWKRVFTNFAWYDFKPLLSEKSASHYLVVFVIFTFILFVFDLIQRKQQVRTYFNRTPYPVRIVILSVLLVLIFTFGLKSMHDGGFMYAQF